MFRCRRFWGEELCCHLKIQRKRGCSCQKTGWASPLGGSTRPLHTITKSRGWNLWSTKIWRRKENLSSIRHIKLRFKMMTMFWMCSGRRARKGRRCPRWLRDLGLVRKFIKKSRRQWIKIRKTNWFRRVMKGTREGQWCPRSIIRSMAQRSSWRPRRSLKASHQTKRL